ncbi:hypothetical protein J6590_057110 [Homalodisca vitripennis]|nr:hypothetical protein J6590_057110 [Homalodisca vitripennis]
MTMEGTQLSQAPDSSLQVTTRTAAYGPEATKTDIWSTLHLQRPWLSVDFLGRLSRPSINSKVYTYETINLYVPPPPPPARCSGDANQHEAKRYPGNVYSRAVGEINGGNITDRKINKTVMTQLKPAIVHCPSWFIRFLKAWLSFPPGSGLAAKIFTCLHLDLNSLPLGITIRF